MVQQLQEKLSSKKVPLTVLGSYTIQLDLLQISISYFHTILKHCLNSQITTVKSDNNNNTSLSEPTVDIKTAKLEKWQRHEAKVQAKAQTAQTSSQSDSNINNNNATPTTKEKKVKEVRWENNRFSPYRSSDETSPYYRVYGIDTIRTHAIFHPDIAESAPNPMLLEKFQTVASYGNVYGQENSENKQGYVFYEYDNNLSEKYPGYTCKLKVLGIFGDWRLLGKKVSAGQLLINGEVQDKPCELYEFDKLVPGH